MFRGPSLLVVLLASTALAGCVDGGLRDEAPVTPVVSESPSPPTSAIVHRAGNGTSAADPAGADLDIPLPARPVGTGRHTGFTTFEPTIGVTSSGAVFVTSFGGLGRGTHIIRSTDQGATWKDMGPFLEVAEVSGTGGAGAVPNSNDPFLYVDPWTDRLVKFDMHVLTTQTWEWSDDDGETWSVATPAFGQPPALQDHQSVTSAPARDVPTQGYPNVFLYCVNRGLPMGGAWCSSSFDAGLTWTPLVPGFPVGTPQCSGLHGHPVGDNAGRFYRGNPSCTGAAVYRSEDSGRTWTQHEVDAAHGTFNHEVTVAVDEADNVYAFWIGDDGLPYFAASADHGETWSEAVLVSPPGVTATDFPTIAAGGPGQVAFAYIGTTHPKGYEAYADDEGNVSWNGYIGVIHDAFADRPVVQTVTANDPADPLHIGRCGGQRCGGFGDFIDIAIDGEGRPWAAFADQCTQACVEEWRNEGGNQMFVGTLASGRSLRGEALLGALPPVPGVDDAVAGTT